MKYLLLICLICISSRLSAQVIDQDGYTYKTVTIGEQEWFAENLRTSKYNDSTYIPNLTDNNAWSALNTGAYCFYDNNAANNDTYGKLYNWYAVETDKLCPMGWHVPTVAEWGILSGYLHEKKMKDHMWSDNNPFDISGFSGLPGGYRNFDGTFYNVGYGFWWSSAKDCNDDASLPNFIDGRYRYSSNKGEGLSVRCLKD